MNHSKVRGRVLCFEETTGKLLWTLSRETNYPPWAFVSGQEPSPNGTPVVQDGKVCATGPQAHNLYCLEAASGKLVWERDLAQDYQIEDTATISASPLVDRGRVILQVGGKPNACVVAFDRKSGREVWRSLNETAGQASPMIIKAGGRRQLIVWTTQSVSSLEPATGKLFWRESFSAGNSSAVATPVFSNNRLLVSGLMLKLEAETGRQIWETDQVTRQKNGSTACTHTTVNGSSVFIYNELGELILAHLSPQGYEEICRTTLVEPTYTFGGRKLTWAAPSFANRHVYARTEKEIICASLSQ